MIQRESPCSPDENANDTRQTFSLTKLSSFFIFPLLQWGQYLDVYDVLKINEFIMYIHDM